MFLCPDGLGRSYCVPGFSVSLFYCPVCPVRSLPHQDWVVVGCFCDTICEGAICTMLVTLSWSNLRCMRMHQHLRMNVEKHMCADQVKLCKCATSTQIVYTAVAS